MLKQRAFKATLWSGLDILLRQGLSLVISIVLARLIAPEQFGVVALLSLFTALAATFLNRGLPSALIQRQDSTHVDETTVYWCNVAFGAIFTLALCAAAPLIARFFAQPVLVPLTMVIASTIFIGSLGTLHGTLLVRELDFRSRMKAGVVASLVSGTLAIVLAWRGYGVWALAWSGVASAACNSAMLWWLHPWRPALAFSGASLRKVVGFGGYVLAAALIDTLYLRLYTLLVGKLFGVRELGYFSRADNTRMLPVGVLNNILSRVTFPVFSSVQQDRARLQRGVRMSVRMMMLVTAPTMLGLAAVAHPLVATLFGARWLPAVPVLEVLCLAGVLEPLHIINLDVLMAQGHSRLFFRLEVVKKTLGVGLLVAGAAWGVMGVAWSMVVFGIAGFFINAFYTGRLLGYGAWQQARDVLPVIAASALMYGAVRALGSAWQPAAPLALASQVAAGLVFMAVAAPLLRLAGLQEAWALLRHGGLSPARDA